MHSKLTTHSLIVMALFAALLCVSSYITISIPTGQHITLQNFFVLLVAFLFPMKQALLILFVWLLTGMIGIPVFAGGYAGISYILSPLGGYSVAFLLIATLVPLLRGKKYNRTYFTILAIFSALLIDCFGAVWLMLLNQLSIKSAFLVGVIPYLPLDIVKAVIVAQIVPQFKRILVTNETGTLSDK